MIRLNKSEALQRNIRQDDIAELAIPTWTLIREAILGGRTHMGLDLMEYECGRNIVMHDSMVNLIETLITHIAGFGEEEVERTWRSVLGSLHPVIIPTELSPLEQLQQDAELFRCHWRNFKITEEEDRYEMKCDPCGTLGKLRRTRSVGVN